MFYGNLIIANNVDWDEIADLMDDDLEDEDIDGSVETNGNGLIVEMDPDNCEEIEISSSYTEEGILQQFEFSYDDETLFAYELMEETDIIFLGFIILIIILITATASTLGIVLFKQKKKREDSINRPSENQGIIGNQVPSPVETSNVIVKQLFCPSCGQKALNHEKFCSQCGTNLFKI